MEVKHAWAIECVSLISQRYGRWVNCGLAWLSCQCQSLEWICRKPGSQGCPAGPAAVSHHCRSCTACRRCSRMGPPPGWPCSTGDTPALGCWAAVGVQGWWSAYSLHSILAHSSWNTHYLSLSCNKHLLVAVIKWQTVNDMVCQMSLTFWLFSTSLELAVHVIVVISVHNEQKGKTSLF